MNNPQIHRFATGRAYRLYTSPSSHLYRSGTMVVRKEIKPRDQWGNRIILADFHLDKSSEDDFAGGAYFGARCFVEEGTIPFGGTFANMGRKVEIAAMQGIYPYFAKAYAIDECETIPADRTAAA